MKKLSLFFLSLFFCCSMMAQTVLNKTVSLNHDAIPISDALLNLSEKTDVNITFSPNFFPKNKTVKISVVEERLKIILDQYLKETGIDFRISKGGIILFRQPPRRFTLSGYLTDAETSERLVGANVFELNSLEGNASNAFGFYSFNFKNGKIKLQVSYLGYQTEIIELDLKKSKTLNISLKPSLTLEEIVVVSKNDTVLLNNKDNKTVLPLDRLSHLPAAAGEADVIRYLQLLPGVQTGADGFGGLHVRGGNSDQNLILLDDVPVYNPSHTFGLFSIFNTSLVKSVQFYKGGFPAKYDSRVSSILDIRTRESNVRKFSGEFSVGSMATRGILEIPFPKEKGGLLIAGRRSHINLWLGPYSEKRKEENELEGKMKYQFTDLNVKGHYTIGKRNKLYLSYYLGFDDFSDDEINDQNGIEDMEPGSPPPGSIVLSSINSFKTDWGNQIISLRWNHLWSDKFFINTTATYSNFKYASNKSSEFQATVFGENFLAEKQNNSYSSEITDFSLRTDADYFIHHQHRLRIGGNAIYRNFVPGLSEFKATGSNLDSIQDFTENNFEENQGIKIGEFSIYGEDEFKIKKWVFNAGLRLTAHVQNGNFELTPQPRFFSSYTFSPALVLKNSITRSVQFLHLITRSDSGLPNDLWVPASKNISPQKSWQFTTGLGGTFQSSWNWNAEVYWKKLDNLFQLSKEKINPGASNLEELQLDANNWETYVEKGIGESIGLEMTLEKHQGKFTGWVSYSFAKSTRNFSIKKDPFKFDSRHSWTVASTFQFTKNIDFSLSWIYQTGLPFSTDDFGEGDIPFVSILQNANSTPLAGSDRLPAYHRLDTGLNFYFGKKRWRHKLQLGVYNTYNQKNIFFTYLTVDPNTGQESVPQSVNSLPILPSIGYSVKW